MTGTLHYQTFTTHVADVSSGDIMLSDKQLSPDTVVRVTIGNGITSAHLTEGEVSTLIRHLTFFVECAKDNEAT